MVKLDARTKNAIISAIKLEQVACVVSSKMARNNSLNNYCKSNDGNRLMSLRLIV